jgi:hypothetical protein
MQRYRILRLLNLSTLAVKEWDSGVAFKVHIPLSTPLDTLHVLASADARTIVTAKIEVSDECDKRMTFAVKNITDVVRHGASTPGSRKERKGMRKTITWAE